MALKDSRLVVVAAKYGGSVAGTDAVAISNEDVRLQPVMGKGEHKCLNGKLGNKTVWTNDNDVTVSAAAVTSFLTGNDSTGASLSDLPDWAELYEICGMTETVDSGVSVTYEPSQAAVSTASEVAIWRDGTKRVATGVVGTYTINGTIGEPLMQTVELSGFTTIEGSADSNPTASCIDEDLLLVLKSTDTMTFTSTAYKGQTFTFTQGNEISKIYGIGTKQFERFDFDSLLEVTYFKEDEDIYGDFADGTSHTIVIQAGTTNGKAMKFTAPVAVVQDLVESSIDGKEAVTVTFSLNGDSGGDDQWLITYGTMA